MWWELKGWWISVSWKIIVDYWTINQEEDNCSHSSNSFKTVVKNSHMMYHVLGNLVKVFIHNTILFIPKVWCYLIADELAILYTIKLHIQKQTSCKLHNPPPALETCWVKCKECDICMKYHIPYIFTGELYLGSLPVYTMNTLAPVMTYLDILSQSFKTHFVSRTHL